MIMVSIAACVLHVNKSKRKLPAKGAGSIIMSLSALVAMVASGSCPPERTYSLRNHGFRSMPSLKYLLSEEPWPFS